MLLPVDIDAYFIKCVTDVTYINSCLIKLRHANWKVHKTIYVIYFFICLHFSKRADNIQYFYLQCYKCYEIMISVSVVWYLVTLCNSEQML